EELNAKYIPVNTAEEQAGIYRLMDLWEQVLKELCEEYEAKRFSEFADEQAYTRYLYGEIHRFCELKKKKAGVLLDNFDRIVGNFSDDGHLLRETLINYRDIVLIAASTRMDEHFWRYDQPFYEFFRRHRLETLTSAETFLLLNHWSDSLDFDEKEKAKMKDFLKNNPGKVENIRLLTDGLPRTMLFFLKLVLQTEKPVEVDFLKKVMDEVTPLYQERLQNLTSQMRKMVLEMAFMWEAVATKEIAEQCRMESKLVAANLKTLTDRNIVETIATDKRNNLYRIAERFFNMWLIVTQGNPDQKRKARWMSEFLECWYDKQELQDMARQHIENLKAHKIVGKEALMLTSGLGLSKYISTRYRDEMIELTKADLKDSTNYLIHLPESIKEITKKIVEFEKTNPQKAIELINSVENEDDGWKENALGFVYDNQEKFDLAEKYFLMAIEKGDSDAMFNLGHLYKNQEKFDLAEKYYLLAIEKGDNKALLNLGNLYCNQEKFDLSEKYYLQAIEKGDSNAMFNLGNLYANQEKFDLAERYYLQTIEKDYPAAMFNLGLLYYNQEKFGLAEKYYLQAIEKGNIEGMFNLGNLYYNQEKFDLAEKYWLLAIEKGINEAMNNLGHLYYNQEKFDLAEKYYLQAIENGDINAMSNLGLLYYNQEKFDLAEKYYLLAIEKGNSDAMSNLGLLYYNQEKFDLAEKYYLLAIEKDYPAAMCNLGNLYYKQEKIELAEKYYLQASEKGENDAMNNLGHLYANQEKFDLAEKYYLLAIEKGHSNAMYNLGHLYAKQEKIDLAEKYYLLAIEKGDNNAMFNLALMYYFQNKNKEQVKQYITQFEGKDIGKIIVEIWAGIFNNVEKRTIATCREGRENAVFIEDLLVHSQKSLVDKLFHHPEFGKRLQAQYTVLYYASQILNGKEKENNLLLRIPPELQTTVEAVLQKIKVKQERYAKPF
ncbi:MAG: sel1 repeat family protein, partial [Dysgonamonadaceae bacterium]|nr:sel1 repeat family protein [Dysgonamonadaceae bacterium]